MTAKVLAIWVLSRMERTSKTGSRESIPWMAFSTIGSRSTGFPSVFTCTIVSYPGCWK